MSEFKSLEEANEVSAVRLVGKRQRAKVGDIFRLSPRSGVFLWGRLIKRAKFFGLNAEFNLVYIYDAIGPDRPSRVVLSPQNLIIGPSVVNNLGWVRGYWEIVASEPVTPADMLDHHFFIRYRGTGPQRDYDIVDEQGFRAQSPEVEPSNLTQSGFGNFNSIDWRISAILRGRGLI
jgi:hypothetical protein